MKALWLAMAGFAAVHAASATAATVKAQDPQSLVKAMQDAGYAAKLSTDKDGDPMISSGASGSSFIVLFYNCTNHKNCATVQFYSGYNVEKAPSLQLINEWNQKSRFGRAYIDKDQDPVVEMDLDLDDGGLSAGLFVDNLEIWASLISSFEKHIGYRK